MNPSTPHYLLFSEPSDGSQGVWRFVLRSIHGTDWLEASDKEPGVRGERLELLTVVRGLEALDQPSKVTLMTPSKYVREGIRYGLSEWRDNGWRWEFYGEMVPVKNRDLWQRVDRAMRFHEVDCRRWRFDASHGTDVVRPPLTKGERNVDDADRKKDRCRDQNREKGGSRLLPERPTTYSAQKVPATFFAGRPGKTRGWARRLSAAVRRLAACPSRGLEGLAGDTGSG